MAHDTNTGWRRIVAQIAQQRRLADAAADEARLIVASGELGLRHAADITQASPAPDKRRSATFAQYRSVRLLPEILSYAMSATAAAALIAAVLLIVGSRGGVVPLLH